MRTVPAIAISKGHVLHVDLAEPARLEAIANALAFGLKKHKEQVWPSAPVLAASQIKQMIVPLDRLGTQQGFSGASVFVAYLWDEQRKYLPSKPLIVKVGKHNDLAGELLRAANWPLNTSGHDKHFAKPFLLSPTRASTRSDLGVLVAPFSSGQALQKRGPAWAFSHVDLWRWLTSPTVPIEPTEELLACIAQVYPLLHDAHRLGRYNCVRRKFLLGAEYGAYLRHLHNTRKQIPLALFGDRLKTHAFGRDWPNPGRIVAKLLSLPKVVGAVGAVHGDLHPKNVVLDKASSPHVIDFGWATARGHVVRDYVLMEMNLRAMTISPHLPTDSLIEFAAVLDRDSKAKSQIPAIASRLRLLREGIWNELTRNEVVEDWDTEYLIPLFLVAFGLLKHLESARNQAALLITVLSLAERLDTALGRKKRRTT